MQNAQDTINISKSRRKSLVKLVEKFDHRKAISSFDIFAINQEKDKTYKYNTYANKIIESFNSASSQPEDLSIKELERAIQSFINSERGSEGLGTETLEMQLAIAARKFMLMSVMLTKLSTQHERNKYCYEYYLPEIDYTKSQIDNKFKKVESNHRHIFNFHALENLQGKKIFHLWYSGNRLYFPAVNFSTDPKIREKEIAAFLECHIKNMDKVARDLWKQYSRNRIFDELKNHILSKRTNGDISYSYSKDMNRWKLEPIAGTNQMRYYRYDLGSKPVALESLVLNFNKTYRNANIRLLSQNTTVGMINAGGAKPGELFIHNFNGVKVTRIEITPISSTSDIKESFVYGTNLAFSAYYHGIKDGKPIDGGLYMQNIGFFLGNMIVHDPGVGTRLHLHAPQKLFSKTSKDCVRINNLRGANDGIRNITVTYRKIDESILIAQNYSFRMSNSEYHDVIIPAPLSNHEVAMIDVTSQDHLFMYKNIEVYKPDNFPKD